MGQIEMSRVIGRGSLLLKKYSPEILLGLGVSGVVAATVMIAKAAQEHEEVKEAVNLHFEVIEKMKTEEPYTQEQQAKDIVNASLNAVVLWGKLYGPGISMMGAGLAAIVGSHGVMRNREASLMAAYSLLNQGFKSYRKNVVDELGEDRDREFRFGIREEIVEEVTTLKSGKKKTQKTKKPGFNPQAASDYAKFFDETSLQWRNDPELNMFFLKAQEQYANDKLRSQGHLFLNEVYDALGIRRTSAGARVGWVLDDTSFEDQFVDFGIYAIRNGAFVNAMESSCILDFNVQGDIHDLI